MRERSALWTERASTALDALACRPWTLFAVLLTLNTLARPYANIIHDAQLYAVQVLHQLDPSAFGEDLFFRFGSQDQYSLFSRVVSPLAALLGLPGAFFVVYLLCNAFFVCALERFVLTLLPCSRMAVLSLFFLVVAPLSYSGLQVLHVHEPFLTPRLPACALVLLGLESALRQRWRAALLWTIAAGVVHPLMALAGVLVVVGLFSIDRCGGATFSVVAGIAAAGALVVVLVQPLGIALLGHLDPEWRGMLYRGEPLFFPACWPLSDWLSAAFSLLVLLGCILLVARADPSRLRFLIVVTVVGIASVAAALLSSLLPYALLLQAQPYRWLWLLKVVQAPAAIWLAQHLWQRYPQSGPYLALAVVAYLGLTTTLAFELLLPLFLLASLVWVARLRGWPAWTALWASCVLGFVGFNIYKLALAVHFRHQLLALIDATEYVQTLLQNVAPLVWCLLALAVITWLYRRGYFGQRMVFGAAALCLAIQTSFFYFSSQHGESRADVQFVARFLEERRGVSPPVAPTVYSPLGRVEYVWVGWGARSYFDMFQIAGMLFHRETAVESQRRALAAAPFEIQRLRQREQFLLPCVKSHAAEFFARDLTAPAPQADDLLRLCRDPILDYVILRDRFDGLYAATNGRLFIYDCASLRAVSRAGVVVGHVSNVPDRSNVKTCTSTLKTCSTLVVVGQVSNLPSVARASWKLAPQSHTASETDNSPR